MFFDNLYRWTTSECNGKQPWTGSCSLFLQFSFIFEVSELQAGPLELPARRWLTVTTSSNLLPSCHLDQHEVRFSIVFLAHRCTSQRVQMKSLHLRPLPDPHNARCFNLDMCPWRWWRRRGRIATPSSDLKNETRYRRFVFMRAKSLFSSADWSSISSVSVFGSVSCMLAWHKRRGNRP